MKRTRVALVTVLLAVTVAGVGVAVASQGAPALPEEARAITDKIIDGKTAAAGLKVPVRKPSALPKNVTLVSDRGVPIVKLSAEGGATEDSPGLATILSANGQPVEVVQLAVERSNPSQQPNTDSVVVKGTKVQVSKHGDYTTLTAYEKHPGDRDELLTVRGAVDLATLKAILESYLTAK